MLLAGTAQAEQPLVVADFTLGSDSKGVPKGWQLKEKAGHADFSVRELGGLTALVLRSADTSYSFQREVNVDIRRYPVLSWKWRVDRLPTGADFRRTKTDDQAAQLFLAFSRSQTLVYLWDTSAPQGLMQDAPSPPFMKIKAVVVRSGPAELGKWISETRNVYEDYRKAFGDDVKSIVSGMRLQINTQHTRTSAESAFAEVEFKSQ